MATAAPVFSSAAPIVRLVNAFDQPYNNAVATALTCYAPRVITPDDVQRDDRARAQRDAIARSTYEAGHHTTLQHASFQFVLENVSRQLIWSFLHAHPFYNSEQVSQRYVAVKPERVLIPGLPPRAAALYGQTVERQMQAYRDLVELLTPAAADAYFAVFPARRKKAEQYKGAVKKKAQEVARYVLPLATFAHLYHTVSGITLHRYSRLCNMLDVPAETRELVRLMVEQVRAHDPLFFDHLEDPLPLESTHEYQTLRDVGRLEVSPSARAFRDTFDAELDGKYARLLAATPRGEALLARSVRTTLGLTQVELSDEAALQRVLSPQHNPYLAGALNLTSMGKITRAMAHVHYTFQKKLSHSADSQDQRHRMTPGSRPVLHTHYVGGAPDVVVPPLLSAHPQAMDLFMEVAQQTWQAIDGLLDQGVAAEQALYLLPNAFPVRFEESGDLMAFHHKWTTRLCYNAQDEIWRASVQEVQAVRQEHPRIAGYILPPCGLRQDAGLRPLCPEGARYCGVPVWKYDLDSYARVI